MEFAAIWLNTGGLPALFRVNYVKSNLEEMDIKSAFRALG